MQSNLTTFYYPLAASGEIVGILNTMQAEMNTDLTDTTAAEKSAIAAFDGLAKAKTTEINALTNAIKSKAGRVGELRVKIAQMKT